MGSAAAGPISDKTARGARDKIGLSICCSSACKRAAGRSLHRFVGSGACPPGRSDHQFYGKGHLNPGLTNDDRDEDREGVYGFESPAAPGSSPRKHV